MYAFREWDPSSPTADLISRLRRAMERLPRDVRVRDLEPLAEGLEAVVLRGRTCASTPVAVRVPRQRFISNENDPSLDARELLRQEAALLEYVRGHGLPAPAVVSLHCGEQCDFLVTELLVADGSEPSRLEMGRLAAKLHRLPTPEMPLVANPGNVVIATLAERVRRRAQVVERRTGCALELPSEEELQRLLASRGAERRLLHMDFRPANLLARGTMVVGIVDWSNALLADPALELARVAESGYLDGAFLRGYGEPDPFRRVPDPVMVLYRLDTALMLAVVFLSEAPQPSRAVRQVDRIRWLSGELRRNVG